MARKFSLKDNPIFQRLEVPKPKDLPEDVVEGINQDSNPKHILLDEGQNLSLKNRASKIEPQNNILPNQDQPKEEDPVESGAAQEFSTKSEAEIGVEKVDSRYSITRSIVEQETAQLTTLADQENANQEQTHSVITINHNEENTESIFDPQNLSVKNYPSTLATDDVSQAKETDVRLNPPKDRVRTPEQKQSQRQKGALSLEDHIEKSLFFGFYNEVTDGLLPTLNPAEQILYSRLFRLSYGFNRNYCTVSQHLLRERTGLSRNTIRTSLQSLVLQEWLHVIEAGNHVSTTYRVVLPRERAEESNIDPQILTLKNRTSKKEAHDLRLKRRGSKFDLLEGQKTGLQNLTLKDKKRNFHRKDPMLDRTASKFDPQNLTPLLITNNSLTLSEKERNSSQTYEELCASAEHIVETFYALLSQKPASVKRQKSVAECLALLQDGFSVDQVYYAIQWTVTKLPETGSFSRVVHFIDQALKAHREGEKVIEKKRDSDSDENYRRLHERQQEEQEKRIDEIRGSLSSDEIEKLTLEASQMVADEHGNLQFGRETLIQIKIRELIRRRHIVS